WQQSSDNGATYTDIAGATSSSLAIDPVSEAHVGLRFRAVLHGQCNDAFSMPARLWTGAPLVVTSRDDDGPGSLRDTIRNAQARDTITFADNVVYGTITLSSELMLDRDGAIQGPGAQNLAISGGNASRVFNVPVGVTVTIAGVTVKNGRAADGRGGAIANGGVLELLDSALVDSSAAGGNGDFGRNAAFNNPSSVLGAGGGGGGGGGA